MVVPKVRSTEWVEQRFGRFPWREHPKQLGRIEILGEWERQNIISLAPPIPLVDGHGRKIAVIRCHRLAAAPLRRALTELAEMKLGHLINTFDGCFVARHINWDRRFGLSRHSWGIAVDLNARLLPRGTRKCQDARVISAFKRQGFSYGGDWGTPDPMHFEIVDLSEPAGNLNILVDGERVAGGFLQEGVAIAPVRALAEALGATVEARIKDGEIEIYSGGEWE